DVVATVDGVSSNPLAISFAPASVQVRTLTLATNSLLLNPASGTIFATVPGNSQTDGNSIVEINPTAGTILGATFVGSEPGPMALSDDGSTLFVGLEGSSMIREFNVPTTTPGVQFSVGSSQ